MLNRGVLSVVSLFMGDLLVFFDASFKINEPMKCGLKAPICKIVYVVHWMNGSDSCSGFGLKDSSVGEEQRDLLSTNTERSLTVSSTLVFIDAVLSDVTVKLFMCFHKPAVLKTIIKKNGKCRQCFLLLADFIAQMWSWCKRL